MISQAQLKLLRHDLANENRVTELQIGRLARIKIERTRFSAEYAVALDQMITELAKASLSAKTVIELIDSQLQE